MRVCVCFLWKMFAASVAVFGLERVDDGENRLLQPARDCEMLLIFLMKNLDPFSVVVALAHQFGNYEIDFVKHYEMKKNCTLLNKVFHSHISCCKTSVNGDEGCVVKKKEVKKQVDWMTLNTMIELLLSLLIISRWRLER